jgi:hypothetical protein
MMTEAEWLTREDPEDLLRFIKQHRGMRRQKKQRKQRLFSVACCRRICPLIGNDRSRACVEVAERFADGRATSEELRAAEAEASAVWSKCAADDALFACVQVCWKSDNGMHVSTTTISAVFGQQQREAGSPVDVLGGRKRGACPHEEREQCRLLRCIFGNPFRPVLFAPGWRTDNMVGIARKMYDERDFAAMPILAGALEEAGADNEDILNHCRGPGPHVRGCWVVDLLLGNE